MGPRSGGSTCMVTCVVPPVEAPSVSASRPKNSSIGPVERADAGRPDMSSTCGGSLTNASVGGGARLGAYRERGGSTTTGVSGDIAAGPSS